MTPKDVNKDVFIDSGSKQGEIDTVKINETFNSINPPEDSKQNEKDINEDGIVTIMINLNDTFLKKPANI